jgi:dUTP pyrophosphatase
MDLKVFLLDKQGNLPERKNSTDAGADIRSCESMDIYPGEVALVHSGISVEIPEGTAGFLLSRSGHGKLKVTLANSVGLIDHTYRGELMMLVQNEGSEVFKLNEGDRVAQLVIVPVLFPTFSEYTDSHGSWVNTDRGESGFGSTGVA